MGIRSLLPLLLAAAPVAASGADRDGPHALEVTFVGANLTRPGGAVGYSYRAVTSPEGRHALVVGAQLGAYHWAKHSTGLFLVPNVGWRGRHRVGLQGEVLAQVGYLHKLLPGEVVAVEDGEVVDVAHPGFPALVVGPMVGVGWHVAEVGVTPFLRAGAWWEWPVFDRTMLRMQWSVGVEVRL